MTQIQDDLLAPRFAALANPVDDSDWKDVVRRAQPRPQVRRHRRLVFAFAFVFAGVLVAAAFATGLADRFSAWVSGSPGRPAPAQVQRGFEQRNRAAYASFPAGTKLRLLLSRTAGGTTFSLLGFRNGDAYCLRLIRADLPNGIGRNECLRADELSGIPALVAGDAWFSIGKPAKRISGVYGFASDDVRSVVIVRARGSERVPVVNNVFLSLGAQAAGSVQHHPLPNPVLVVHALLRDGSSRVVPYVAEGRGVVPGGKRLTVPSYFASPSSTPLPGPTKVVAPIAHPRIGWLIRKEPRGKPLPKQQFLRVGFGRVIQPDPDDPIRIGIATGKITTPPGVPRSRNLQPPSICVIDFQPLARAAGGAGCMPASFPNGPLALGVFAATPITHFNGVAADGITYIRAYLSGGRIVQAALRDNAFSVALPQAELPGKLVGYDAHNRVAAIVPLQGNAVAKPCPAAAFTTPVSQLPTPKPWEKINLATLTVNGQHILGMTPQQVEVALGKPAVIRGNAQTTNGVPNPEFRYGGSLPSTLGLSIGFSKKGDRIFANSLSYQSPSLVDAKLGHVLRMQPAELQQAITRTYGSTLHVFRSYGSNPASGCSAVLKERDAASGIGIGLNPYRPSRPYLDIVANASG